MLITLVFGDNQNEIFNGNCRIIHLVNHIKKTCGLTGKVLLDLMDAENGKVLGLWKKASSQESATSILQVRKRYILHEVLREDTVEVETLKYVPLLTDFSKHYPKLSVPLIANVKPQTFPKAVPKKNQRKGKEIH